MKEINYEKRLDALEELETLHKFRNEAIFKDKYIETFYFIRKEEIQYDTHSKIMNIINKELNFSNDTINEFKDMGYTILETIVII
ncbi:MAG TPA: hypothetical protein PLV67_08125 [Methanofastidiosum sp.]|nr:hypothetical protein [Methanofastidiosum sp.]